MPERLGRDEVARRVVAARILRGERACGQRQQKPFARWLRDVYDVKYTAYIEYEEGKRELTGRDRLSLAKALDLPERWFTEPNLDQVFGIGDAKPVPQTTSAEVEAEIEKDFKIEPERRRKQAG